MTAVSLPDSVRAACAWVAGRADAVHAVELLADASPLSRAEIDSVLWNRSRNTAH